MLPDGYYSLLGVSRNATAAEVRRAYRMLVLKWHPDVNPVPGAEQRLKSLNEAYMTLRDVSSRERYNKSLDIMAISRYSERSRFIGPKSVADRRRCSIKPLLIIAIMAGACIYICLSSLNSTPVPVEWYNKAPNTNNIHRVGSQPENAKSNTYTHTPGVVQPNA